MCFTEEKEGSCTLAGGCTREEELDKLKRNATKLIREEVKLPLIKMNPEKSRLDAGWRSKITFTSVIEDLRQEARKRAKPQNNTEDTLKLYGSHERASESNANKLEEDALTKNLNPGYAPLLSTGAKVQSEGRSVRCKEGNAQTVNEKLQNREGQRTQTLKHTGDRSKLQDTLGTASADAQVKQIKKGPLDRVGDTETKARQFAKSAQVADILQTAGRACNFLSCQVEEREQIRGKNNRLWLVAVPEAVLQGNLLNMYNIEFFEGERGCVTRLRSVQGVGIHVKLCDGGNWTADDFPLTRGLLEGIGRREDKKLSTTSGTTMPRQSVPGTSPYTRNRGISHVDTLWEGVECDDDGSSTWGSEFFLLERDSTAANDPYQNSTGKLTCADGDMQRGWAQAVEFTESLLRVDEEAEERGYGKGIYLTDDRCAVVGDADQRDSVCGQTGKEKDVHFLTTNQVAYPPRNREHYASFLADTNLIESILGRCVPV